ncbi:MAG: Lrp/AsnC family transcriptional regulator [Methanimicrococcus sp.]|nr:Lrp/AsnC family transcriptional regulator [Methanimicrococcus sp.]
MDKQTQDVLEILEQNAKATPEEISELTRIPPAEVLEMIRTLEAAGVIRSYKTIIDWDLVENPYVYAFVQLKVSLERGHGYQKIADRICKFTEVRSLRLLSGEDYDLEFIIKGKTMKDVAFFVADKIATLPQVQNTSTHFILKTYKEDGVIMEEREEYKRLPVSP